jgi:eight-cysteine-cluster-containing protein
MIPTASDHCSGEGRKEVPMKRFTSAVYVMLAAIPVLLGANDEGCEPRVPIGNEELECITTGCSGEVCAEESIDTVCEWLPEYDCLSLSTCEAQDSPDGGRECGWTQTPEYLQCLEDLETPEDPECITTGCSGEVCAEESIDTFCEWLPEYDCLSLSTCEAQDSPDGGRECGWTQTPEYLQCLEDLL